MLPHQDTHNTRRHRHIQTLVLSVLSVFVCARITFLCARLSHSLSPFPCRAPASCSLFKSSLLGWLHRRSLCPGAHRSPVLSSSSSAVPPPAMRPPGSEPSTVCLRALWRPLTTSHGLFICRHASKQFSLQTYALWRPSISVCLSLLLHLWESDRGPCERRRSGTWGTSLEDSWPFILVHRGRVCGLRRAISFSEVLKSSQYLTPSCS